MSIPVRIGTRESRLAIWQATTVQKMLASNGIHSELVYIKSQGDIDLATPLYEMGVQGIFTRSLDIALLNNQIDIAVHSMKDVPTQLPKGLSPLAVLERGPVHDLLVMKSGASFMDNQEYTANIGTSSIRRRAQWLRRFPHHRMHNLRGNMQTRLQKLHTESWDGAIFARAGLERIDLRPENSLVLDWMLPAPAQGAIMVAGRTDDDDMRKACLPLNDQNTSLCTRIERDFLRGLLGGCSTPVSAYARIKGAFVHFMGSILSPDGKQIVEVEKEVPAADSEALGHHCAEYVLNNGGREISVLIKEQMKKMQ